MPRTYFRTPLTDEGTCNGIEMQVITLMKLKMQINEIKV